MRVFHFLVRGQPVVLLRFSNAASCLNVLGEVKYYVRRVFSIHGGKNGKIYHNIGLGIFYFFRFVETRLKMVVQT